MDLLGTAEPIHAHAVPGGYRVSGEWHFASGCRQATWMGAHGQVVEPDGSLRLNRFGRPTIRTLLFRKEQTQPIEDWDTIGMRGTASEGYRVDDLFVPEEYSGTREDPTLRRDPGPLYAFTMPGLYAVGVAGRRVRASPAPCWTRSSRWRGKNAARPAAPGGQAGRASRRGSARGGAGSARAWLMEILKDVWDAARTTSRRSTSPRG